MMQLRLVTAAEVPWILGLVALMKIAPTRALRLQELGIAQTPLRNAGSTLQGDEIAPHSTMAVDNGMLTVIETDLHMTLTQRGRNQTILTVAGRRHTRESLEDKSIKTTYRRQRTQASEIDLRVSHRLHRLLQFLTLKTMMNGSRTNSKLPRLRLRLDLTAETEA
ncbi:hypothetical protein K435DRAFT_100302 [Dendrothele bispora CBS 962.96]|uniref:Uncharacterized protein n=1 Tax=Dendrothele bispora (strain CBS 962.96) TaxID=1314807 RepID=A0A4S8M2C2_DENBC|nr:hypothetical protein K435DRAFT_100302 [Dendrothele bispora CBS 962.96]